MADTRHKAGAYPTTNRLTLLKKKFQGMILNARFRPAILLCLGSEVSLSLWPSSGLGIWRQEDSFDGEIITDSKTNVVDVDHIESVRTYSKPL
jgi:hypothetical protein